MGDVMVDVNHVSIRFIQNQEKVDNLKEYFIKLVTRKLKYDDFWALTDVNFRIERGERLGVLGFNGAGKSTLLKTVAGVLKPTKGTVTTRGVIAPLLELGAGFDANLSARENIYLNGAILGYSRAHIAVRHILPNLSDVLLSRFLLGVNSCIMMESTLSFLGLGDLYRPTWGTMVNFAYKRGAFLRGAYQYLLAPGVCVMLLCLAFYLISLWLTARKETISEG